MNYNILGKSDLRISEIAFGCMSLNGDDAANATLVSRAIELGINFFDTADLYDHGRNEASLGKALRGKRQDVIIATKVGNQWRPDGSGWDWNPRKEYIVTAVEDSLRRLQTDYIDLYQLHGGTVDDPIEESIDAFELLKQQGKIRHYGISSIRPNVIREYLRKSNIVSVMMQYSLLDRRPEEFCLPLLLEQNVGVLARGGVAKGLLAGKPPAEYLNYNLLDVATAAKQVAALSGAERVPAQTALRFVLQNPAISAAVVGIRTREQLEEAAGTPGTPPLKDSEMDILRQAIRINLYDQHR
ncbi:aldo/keto reductase [Chitinophaga sedimenti]|uniref:aldo/keto reductase n=1 Tax=Chitinophaga sedimenti TaxID=2033606 RepID=UPI0020051354|nr:aldo/keto reductase [Chitinophaga sedimenti]MCK7557499.1 aldo/keto reductase [Chitinophaga sedimenti]